MAVKEATPVKVDRRILPETLRGLVWFEIEDPTALATGDWIFDPSNGAQYAGEILNILDGMVALYWHKNRGECFGFTHTLDEMTQFLWADPVLQP